MAGPTSTWYKLSPYIPIINAPGTSCSISSNTYYVFTTALSAVTVTLLDVTDSTIYNEYMFEFTTTDTLPSTGPSITINGATVLWTGEIPNKTSSVYQVSIVNNVAVCACGSSNAETTTTTG